MRRYFYVEKKQLEEAEVEKKKRKKNSWLTEAVLF